MAVLFSDPFNGDLYKDINGSGTSGQGRWSYHTSYGGSSVRFYIVGPSPSTRRISTGQPGSVRANVDPPTANYGITVDYCLFSNLPSLRFGPTIRHQSADTYYTVWYQDGELALVKRVAGVDTVLDTWSEPLEYGTSGPGGVPVVYTLRLEANGTAIGAYLDGVLRVSATDSTLTAAGRPGLQGRATHPSAYTGIHADNYVVTDDTSLSLTRFQVIPFVGV